MPPAARHRSYTAATLVTITALSAVTAGVLTACAPGSTVADPSPATVSSPITGSPEGAGGVPPSGGPATAGPDGAAAAGAGEPSGPGSTATGYGAPGGGPASSVAAADGVGARIVGTDSDATSVPPAPADPGLAGSLSEFGRRYLAFDYRLDAAQRAEDLRSYVTPELFGQLTAPMPAALAASLAAEQRVVVPTFVDIEALDGGLYRLRYSVHTTIASGGQTVPAGPDETRTLMVTVDAARLVSDVR